VRESGAGLVVPPQDVGALAEAMLQLASRPTAELQEMGARGARFYRDNLSYGRALRQTHEVLTRVLSGRPLVQGPRDKRANI
jgi:glycosyltransferase involved in cell wall biosynthesis